MGFSSGLLISVMIKMLLLSKTKGAARFTVVPPRVIYVSVGETAKLVWDYTVDNRNEEFDIFSPRWLFYADDGSAFLIARENVFDKGKWSIIINTCPARLLNPVRVSKESTATLVIHNVTLADSGTYGCVLVLSTRSPITSKVKLIVTSLPYIMLNPVSSKIPVNEFQALSINCSAVGTPTPNVTWQRVHDDVMNQGVGKAILNITNITRDYHGMYTCCANKNLNKSPVCRNILVSVQYKPEIDILLSNSTLASHIGGAISLYCVARGVPTPMFTWYDPTNQSITAGLHNITGGSVLEQVTINPDIYGLYRCKAENILGYDEHFINVTHTALPTSIETSKYIRNVISPTSTFIQGHNSRTKPKEMSCSTLDFQGRTFATVHLVVTSISIVGNVIMAVLVCYMAKRTGFKDVWKKNSKQRVSPEDYFVMKMDGIQIVEPQEPAASNSPHDSPNLIQPAINNEAFSRESTPGLMDERKPKENPVEQNFPSGSIYQQLNDGFPMSTERDYQSLQREEDETKQPFKLSSMTVSNFNHQQQASAYQPLHLYSNIGEK